MNLCLLYMVSCSSIDTKEKCTIKVDPKSKRTKADCRNKNLTSVPLDLPADINVLDLAGNLFTFIGNSDFKRFVVLSEINLNNNEIMALDTHAFYLPLLTKLQLSNNHLNVSDSYSENVFHSSSKLRELDIKRNMRYASYSENPLDYNLPGSSLINLEVLVIDLVCFPKFNSSFQKMSNLQTLIFDDCFICYLSNETFMYFPQNVKELQMRSCQYFFVVEIDALKYFPVLRILDISDTPISLSQALQMVYPLQNTNMDLINFHHVSVENSQIYPYDVILTPKLMEYISTICIKTLDISENSICSIRNKSLILFQHPQCFEQLILSANRFGLGYFISYFVSFVYRMTNLTLFDNSYVPLEYKNPQFLHDSQTLDLRVKDSRISKGNFEKPSFTFHIPKNLKYVRVSHVMAINYVQIIDISNTTLATLDFSYYNTDMFPRFICNGFNNLKYLDISGIESTKTFGQFPILKHLKILKMAHSQLYKLIPQNVTIFNWTTYLTSLDVSHNYLWYVGEKSFEGLNLLTSLNVSNNMFQTIPREIMSFAHLTELDLSFNLLSMLEDDLTVWINVQNKHFGHFKLYLQGNAFICTCETANFLIWIFDTKANLDMDKNYTCRLPGGGNNFTKNVTEDYHNYFAACNAAIWIKLGVSLLTSICFCIVCITLVYNFRWRILFYFHRKFLIIVEKGLEVNFKYDVYVSYSDDGASFIKNILQPTIEHRWGLRMCCEDRDFDVGASNLDVRARSIHKSRHIIFVITPSFITREWNRFEIERAKYEKFTKDLQKIVVIAHKTSIQNTPTELSTIWNDVCVIEWPEEGGELFTVWQKLRLWLF